MSNNMFEVPIIKLEMQNMRHTMVRALSEYSAQFDKNIQQAVEEYCSDDNLERIIKEEAEASLNKAIKEEVRDFFGGACSGRLAVREAVIKYLNQYYPEK